VRKKQKLLLKRKKRQEKRSRCASVRFIVGLGNPGLAYRVTRHNVGFLVIDRLVRKHGIPLSRRRFRARYGEGRIRDEQIVLIKPRTYMNLSGLPIKDLLAIYDASRKDLIVIHDDLDVNFGWLRIRRRGGHGGHKGVQSIIQTTGGSDFVRLKVGIGRPKGGAPDATAYVLHPFERGEKACLGSILSTAVEAVETIVLEGVEKAMNVFNRVVACEKRGG
jgi:PTH1 family peptidyl-tRNA hydrolase